MSCRRLERRACIRIGDRSDYYIDLLPEVARMWRAGAYNPEGLRRRPTRGTGFEYQATTAGHSGNREPRRWPTVEGETVIDGSTVWTARPVTNDSLLKTIDQVEWSAPGGVTVTGEMVITTFGRQLIGAYLQPTTQGPHEIEARVTFSDAPQQVSTWVFGLDTE